MAFRACVVVTGVCVVAGRPGLWLGAGFVIGRGAFVVTAPAVVVLAAAVDVVRNRVVNCAAVVVMLPLALNPGL